MELFFQDCSNLEMWLFTYLLSFKVNFMTLKGLDFGYYGLHMSLLTRPPPLQCVEIFSLPLQISSSQDMFDNFSLILKHKMAATYVSLSVMNPCVEIFPLPPLEQRYYTQSSQICRRYSSLQKLVWEYFWLHFEKQNGCHMRIFLIGI